MHPNPAFRKTAADQNLAFARARGFGVLSVNGPAGPLMAHVPFLLSQDGTAADLHLARSNAVIAAGLPAQAVLAVTRLWAWDAEHVASFNVVLSFCFLFFASRRPLFRFKLN